MAAPLADLVIYLRDGRVVSQGSVKDVFAKDKRLAEQLKHEEEAIELDEHEETELSNSAKSDDQNGLPQANGELVVAEEIEVGHVSWRACECTLRVVSKFDTDLKL